MNYLGVLCGKMYFLIYASQFSIYYTVSRASSAGDRMEHEWQRACS